jgi:hypothetical protein
MTLAEGLDRKKIEALLQAKYPKLEIHTYQDVVHATPHLDDPTSGDIFFFDVSLCQISGTGGGRASNLGRGGGGSRSGKPRAGGPTPAVPCGGRGGGGMRAPRMGLGLFSCGLRHTTPGQPAITFSLM